ncbi:unnamed protein product, partial [Closterium sp. NIES-53]
MRFQSIQCHPCSLLSLSAPLCLLSLSASLSLTSHQVLDCYEMQPTNSAFLHLVKLFPEVRAAAVLAVLCCAVLCRGVCFHLPLYVDMDASSLLYASVQTLAHYHCLIATAAAASAAGSKGAKEGGGNSKGGEKGSAGKAGAGGGGAGRGDGDGEGGEKGEGGSGAEGRIPDSLFVLAANCLKSNVVQLAGLYPFLDPPDEEAEARSKEINAQRIADVNRIGKINLAATGRDLTDDPQPADVTIDLYGAVDGQESAAAKEWGEAEGNDKMRLLKALLLVDDWPHARQLLEHLRPLHPVAHPPICTALCSLISRSIAPAYHAVRPAYLLNLKNQHPADVTSSPNLPSSLGASRASDGDVDMTEAGPVDGVAGGRRKGERARGDEEDGEGEGEKDRGVGKEVVESRTGGTQVPRRVFEMLRFLGAFLYQDTILLQKLCKVLKADLLQARAAAATAAATAAASAASSAPAALCNGPSLGALTPAATANGPVSPEPDSLLAAPDAPAATAASAAAETAAAAAREVEGRVVEALEASLLPALQAVVASPPVCMQLWEVLACLPFQERYRLYGEWEKETETNPLVLAARQIAR